VYLESDSGKFVTMRTLDCRGVDIDKWIITNKNEGWSAEGLSGSKFAGFDINDFYDYDNKKQCEVQISEIQSKVVKLQS